MVTTGVRWQVPDRVPPPLRARASTPVASLLALFELTKPGLTGMVVVTAGAGFLAAGSGGHGSFDAVLGIGLAAGGSAALNQYMERRHDALMRRTRGRPIPSGRIPGSWALVFGLLLSLLGCAYLAVRVNGATVLLVAATAVLYLLVYTPLKRMHPVSTWIGALPGALPILAGWTASGRTLDVVAWTLFGILYLWQIPHFVALARRHRADYLWAGFAVLGTAGENGRRAGVTASATAAALLVVSLMPLLYGAAGASYAICAVVLGGAYLAPALALAVRTDVRYATALFLTSIAYLPALLGAFLLFVR